MSGGFEIFLRTQNSFILKVSLKEADQNGFSGVVTVFDKDYTEFSLERNLLAAFSNAKRLSAEPGIIPRISMQKLSELTQTLKLAVGIKIQEDDGLQMQNIIFVMDNHDPEKVGEALRDVLMDFPTFKGRILIELPMIHKSWEVWNKLQSALGFQHNVQLNLVMTDATPPTSLESTRRWLGESTRMVTVDPTCFVANSHGNGLRYVMRQELQDVFLMLVQYTKCIVTIHPRSGNPTKYLREIDNISSRRIILKHHFLERDALRNPLQPLRDNLETETYEIFEEDRVKYPLYQQAIVAAIKSKASQNLPEMVVMVLGAGRGPLVRACVNASKITNQKLKIYVVEKNTNAAVGLLNMIDVLWADEDITLIIKDMRSLNLDVKADIIVSELLGSFGDNELSPECLQNCRDLLKSDGVSIPSNSSTYLRPVMTTEIHNKIKLLDERRVDEKCPSNFDISWVVQLSSAYYIDEPKKLWKFDYPSKNDKRFRYQKLTFTTKIDSVLHGFAGYFKSNLFGNVELSIVPESYSKGLESWYPMFFAIREPKFLKKGSKFHVEFWRKYDETKVWYEWCITGDEVANKDGKSDPIYL